MPACFAVASGGCETRCVTDSPKNIARVIRFMAGQTAEYIPFKDGSAHGTGLAERIGDATEPDSPTPGFPMDTDSPMESRSPPSHEGHPGPSSLENGQTRATLFSSAGPPRAVPWSGLAELVLDDEQLLWVELCTPSRELLAELNETLAMPRAAAALLYTLDGTPTLRSVKNWFAVQVVAVGAGKQTRPAGDVLVLVGGPNVVISATREPLDFIENLRDNGRHSIDIGALQADSFAAAILGAQLATYFEAASRLEADIERLEVAILAATQDDCLDRLRLLRQVASRLRRMLAAHRVVFGGLSRPDFRPQQARREEQHFQHLAIEYERAMDVVEHGRELVVGTVDLFTTRAAMATNETMRVLTFATVLIGMLAVLAGILGMNFQAPFFEAGAFGFWSAVGAMLLLSGAGIWMAKRRSWL